MMTPVSQFPHSPALTATIDRLLAFGKPDDIALVCREGSFTYAQFDSLVSSIATALEGEGLIVGDRVASWMGKTLASAVLPFACARARLVHVPINPLLKPHQVDHILADSGARMIFTLKDRAKLIGKNPEISIYTIEDDWDRFAAQSPGDAVESDPTRLAALLYTSGSTGSPKGVMVTNANLWLGAESVASYLHLTADDRVLAVLPFSFDYGLNQMLSMFRAGGTVVLHDYLLAKITAKAVASHDITVLAGVPPLWLQLAEIEWPDDARHRLRVMTNSGGAMPPSLNRRLREIFPEARLYLMYGLTEAFRSTYLDPDLAESRPESIGKAIPHAEILVVRPDGSLTEPGEKGELVHCGPLVAEGYWRDTERTAQRFKPAPAASVYGGTAVWSGDLAIRDDDGFLSFAGRADEMIKTAGYRVSPTEIEETAIASGAVAECAAFGIADDRLGQAIILIARVAAGLNEAEAEAKLSSHLRTELPNFMQPRRIEWRDMLPRNSNGKLDRTIMKAELAS